MGPHPLEALQAQAAVTPPAQVRAELTERAAAYLAFLVPGGWGAGAEDTLRRVLGMERKMGMEMRIGLGERGADLPHRVTAPLAELGLPELLEEARATRTRTLALLDRVLAAPDDVRVWTFGEGDGPPLDLLALRGRRGWNRGPPTEGAFPRRHGPQKSALSGR